MEVEVEIDSEVYDLLMERAKEKGMSISEYVAFLAALDRKDVC